MTALTPALRNIIAENGECWCFAAPQTFQNQKFDMLKFTTNCAINDPMMLAVHGRAHKPSNVS